jgi:hypothetical protein
LPARGCYGKSGRRTRPRGRTFSLRGMDSSTWLAKSAIAAQRMRQPVLEPLRTATKQVE